MDQTVRNKLRNTVTQCRKLLEDATAQTLQGHFGIFPGRKKGDVQIEDESRMAHLTKEDRACRQDLVDHLEHIQAIGHKPVEALDQLIREISFTHLNRFCAYKMMESRGLIREAVSRGVKSQGFFFYLADHPEDERIHNSGRQELAYHHFLDWLGGTLSEEVGVLFNPNDPANRIYPPQRIMEEVLALINDAELNDIWSLDETIGWVYQYFTPKELRDKARKESQAPRNSNELAFRNQFFTPRYVVEFLTDNTLGRIWYEMRKGKTILKDRCKYLVRRPIEIFLTESEQPPAESKDAHEDLSQEELLKLPVYIPHRPKKDPRDLKGLDPACGSGHFLLYCFDLFWVIYEEAYDDPELGTALRKDYPAIDDLRRAVPGLILKYNLHGIDIDLRATQIAALALWLRCQRAYQELGLKNGERPKIIRSNIVCAEPMPGETDLLKEFTANLQPKVLGQLVEVIFEKMKLAGEVGSLLKIEEEIREAACKVKSEFVQWKKQQQEAKSSLFPEMAKSKQLSIFDFADITDEVFLDRAEEEIIAAMSQYAKKTTDSGSFRRQLFAEDTTRGLAFVDVVRKRFDVVLMNPPFGLGLKQNFPWLKQSYPDGFVDLLSAFVCRASSLCCGLIGAITSRSILMTKKLERLREGFVIPRITSLLDLGWGVMDAAMVQSCAYTIAGDEVKNPCFVAIDRKQAENKAAPIGYPAINSERHYLVNRRSLRLLPRCQILYSLPPQLLRLLRSENRMRSTVLEAKHGMNTFNNFRFLRLRWEVTPALIGESLEWEPLSKGGPYAVYYLDLPLLVRWNRDGKEIAEENRRANGQTAQARQASTYYHLPGATYSRRSAKDFGVRMLPAGCIIGEKGPAVLATGRYSKEFIIALLNSRLMNFLIHIQANAKQYDSGIIERLPWIEPSAEIIRSLESLAHNCICILKESGSRSETDSDFAGNAFEPSLAGTLAKWDMEMQEARKRVSEYQIQIDELVDGFYGVDSREFKNNFLDSPAEDGSGSEDAEDDEHGESGFSALSLAIVSSAAVSACVGCIFGRWNVERFSEEPIKAKPQLFSPIPIVPPAFLLKTAAPNVTVVADLNGILVDDPEHGKDIIRHITNAFEVIWKTNGEAVEKEASAALNVQELREYFRKPGNGGFWSDHVKRYSKSRRKAPIYWYLRSAKGNYGLWFYYHRLDKDILFKALLNYVEPKIRLEEDRLNSLRSRKEVVGTSGREAKQVEKDIDRQEQFLSELHDFGDKLRRAANLNLIPDLNDGVVLNIAPLWELVPWKEAQEYWEELIEGKYEWSSIGKQLREKGLVRK